MSVAVTHWVWEESGANGPQLLVLLALADAANQEGVAWPKIETIARWTRLSERTVQRHIKELESKDELRVMEGGFVSNRNLSNTYIVTMGRQIVTPPQSAAERHPGGVIREHPPGDSSGHPSEPPVEPSGEPPALAAGAASDDDAALTLPGMAPPPAPLPVAASVDAKVTEVWDYYLATFRDRLRITELTPPRVRTIQKALKATNDDTSLLKQAINGLKSYRAQHPDRSQDVSMSVIFETGPHDRSNLTEKIEWWAMQGGDQADMPSTVPSGLRARVLELALSVLTVERRPDDPAVRERGEQAEMELAKRHNLKVISDGHGKLRAWEVVA